LVRDRRRVEPRQRRAQRIEARRVGILVVLYEAPDGCGDSGELVGGEVNRRHGLNGFSAKTFDPALHGELIAIRHIHHSDRY
jgi:hypothetical protein